MLQFCLYPGCGRTTSNIDVRPGFWKTFSSPAKFVIVAQTLVIGFLSSWLYQEYLNNRFLQIYLDNLFQTTGWAFAALGVVVVLGLVAILVSRHKTGDHAAETEEPEPVTMEVKLPTPIPTGASSNPYEGLHPIVQQLKAELFHSRETAGVAPLTQMEGASASATGQLPKPTHQTIQSTPPTVIVGLGSQTKEKKETQEENAESGDKPASTG